MTVEQLLYLQHFQGQKDFNMKKYIIFFFLFLFFFNCEKERIITQIEPETFVSTAYIPKNGKGIEVNCESINPSAVVKQEFGICWSEKPNPTINDFKQQSGQNSANEGPFVEQILNFKPNTIYYIKAYIKTEDKIIYSEDFVYFPIFPKGWDRLEDIARDNTSNLPFAKILNGRLEVQRKINGFEEIKKYNLNIEGGFWLPETAEDSYLREPFMAEMEYSDKKYDQIVGAGYFLENPLNQKKLYQKTVNTTIYKNLNELPSSENQFWSFGHKNELILLEKNSKPAAWFLNYDTFLWNSLALKNIPNFTNPVGSNLGVTSLILDKNQFENELYEYKDETFTKLGSLPGLKRKDPFIISVDHKIIYGLGSAINGKGLKDLWLFNAQSKTWSQLPDYPGAGNLSLAAVQYNGALYIGLGFATFNSKINTERVFQAYDFWRYKL